MCSIYASFNMVIGQKLSITEHCTVPIMWNGVVDKVCIVCPAIGPKLDGCYH